MIHLDENVPSPTPLLPLHCAGERHVLKMCMKHLGLPFQTVMSLGHCDLDQHLYLFKGSNVKLMFW